MNNLTDAVADLMRHTDLIDAVNDAKTDQDHSAAQAFLNGWRAGQDDAGRAWSPIEADLHTMERFGSARPICCGVLLDWKPAGRQVEPDTLTPGPQHHREPA